MSEACNGPEHGQCINNSLTEDPFCLCKSSGYNETSDCNQCKEKTYGTHCDKSCITCYHGTCDAGFKGNGNCICQDGYNGIDCNQQIIINLLPIIIPVSIFVLLAIAISFEIFRRIKKVKENQEKLQQLIDRESEIDQIA